MIDKIDLVVPYVDSSDAEWQILFNKYNPIKNRSVEEVNAKNRFRGMSNFFRFFFRGIENNMSWINKIHLLVQSESQVPDWLDKSKVHIVLHKDFIPEEYLPTFNSCTIEMFLWNIPELSEKFIYANDDTFVVNNIKMSDLFHDDEVRENFIEHKPSGMFGKHCQNVFNLIFDSTNKFIRPDHELKPYIKSKMIDCFKKYEKEIKQSITQFRDYKNYNCYLYSMYQYKMNVVKESSIISSYMDKVDFKILANADVVTINDIREDNIYDNKLIIKYFLNLFSNTSEYETNNCVFYTKAKELKKVFGIVSWLPEKEPDRTLRIERLNRLLNQINNLFGDNAHYLIVAQNWKNYEVPKCIKNINVFKYTKLGILKARQSLRQHFIESNYDYLIMCDDDCIIEIDNENIPKWYFETLDEHPNGFMFLQYEAAQLNMCAISKYIYQTEPMVNLDPEKMQGYEDTVFSYLLHYKYPKNEFTFTGLRCTQFRNKNEKAPSTWGSSSSSIYKNNWDRTKLYLEQFKKGDFSMKIDTSKYPPITKEVLQKAEWYEKAIFNQWCTKAEYEEFKRKYGL